MYNSDKHKEFHALCDKISTEFAIGTLWHGRSAPCMRASAFRGFGEIHLRMSEHDNKKKLCFEKIVSDRIKYVANTDMSDSQRPASYSFAATPQELKEHFHLWVKREHHYEVILNEAIEMARSIKLAIYDELCAIQRDVQEEITRVEFLIERLDTGGWSGHDVAYVSELYHKHFENGGGMDITLS